jgi:glyoxylase-like metal-dependent hydrolase (beta-lactamase superfamily II)
MFNMPYFDMYVNAYVVRDLESKDVVVFDTSGDCSPILNHLKSNGYRTIYILLTHAHSDHVADLDRLKFSTKAAAFVSRMEPLSGVEPLDEGTVFELGALRIETKLTSGHSIGGLTYVIHGLEKPVAIVGDAMFAGSMGGGLISYESALKNNRAKILTLPDETVLCPGHGPLTTVGEEKKHNPFFPEFQRAEMF